VALEIIVLSRTAVALLIAGIGAAVAVSIKKLSHYALCAMISIAAGALLAVLITDVIPETFELVDAIYVLIGFASGYVLFFLVSKYVSHMCPACAATHTEERFINVNYLMIAAISLHSLMDGIGVAVAANMGNVSLGLMILLAVSIHKFPEGLALASVSRGAGYSRKKAFGVALAVESTTFIGGLVAIAFFGNLSSFWYGILLANIGGGFFYIVAHAMLGEMIKHERKSILIYAGTGFMLIIMVTLLLFAYGI
jgi:zinc transporter ZupT